MIQLLHMRISFGGWQQLRAKNHCKAEQVQITARPDGSSGPDVHFSDHRLVLSLVNLKHEV